jgi:hypothetical protein
MHNRSRVRVRACTSCKSLGQPGFYSLTWAHKVRFSGGGVSSNSKKKNIRNFSLMRMYEIYDKCVVWWSVGEFSIDGSCDRP